MKAESLSKWKDKLKQRKEIKMGGSGGEDKEKSRLIVPGQILQKLSIDFTDKGVAIWSQNKLEIDAIQGLLHQALVTLDLKKVQDQASKIIGAPANLDVRKLNG